MKAKLMHIFRSRPLFLLLLPTFFMLHSLVANFAPGVTGTALIQTLLYTGIAAVLALIFFPATRSLNKAALVSFYILSFNFFFGSLHDAAKKIFGQQALPVRYGFIIPLFLIILVCLVIWLRKTKRELKRAVLFLNLLFLLLIASDLVVLLPKISKKNIYNPPNLSGQFISCDTCSKPDVYVIIADEYAGQQELTDIFSFDNSIFENDLKQRGFHVVNHTKSNYNATVYSMASLFNMGYIELSGKEQVTQRDMLLCRSIIKNNNTGYFFKKQGYSIYNHSFFTLHGKKKAVNNYYFHPISRILTFETFTNRISRDVGHNFHSKERYRAIYRNDFLNDERVDSLTKITALPGNAGPRFVYTHFTRPHHPYFAGRDGRHFVPPDSLRGFPRLQKEYTEHILYTNRRLLELIDHIRLHSANPPIILLASDHGFRQFREKADQKYYFMNLCAVYLPGGDYSLFYDGMSPVNTFRVILNSQFGQQLPLLKDSSTFLYEK
ncbi:MAG: hypothetical protein ACT4OJ_12660 [Bacteroidota bacterium]